MYYDNLFNDLRKVLDKRAYNGVINAIKLITIIFAAVDRTGESSHSKPVAQGSKYLAIYDNIYHP